MDRESDKGKETSPNGARTEKRGISDRTPKSCYPQTYKPPRIPSVLSPIKSTTPFTHTPTIQIEYLSYIQNDTE